MEKLHDVALFTVWSVKGSMFWSQYDNYHVAYAGRKPKDKATSLTALNNARPQFCITSSASQQAYRHNRIFPPFDLCWCEQLPNVAAHECVEPSTADHDQHLILAVLWVPHLRTIACIYNNITTWYTICAALSALACLA